MNLTKTIVLILLISKCTTSCAQNNYNWNNHKAAVALTYDDALYIHLDKVIPCLDSAGLKGTFYLVGSADPFTKRIADWRKAAAKGHELGNHTVFHPCYGKRPGREWVSNERDLNNYTLQRMTDEIKVNNALLEATDGKKKRTLACPCGDTKIGDSSYLYPLKDQFVAMRDGTPDAVEVNGFANVPVQWVSASQNSGTELIAAVKRAVESRALLIFVFHGVGGEHSINVSAEAHHELVQYLKQHKDEVWTAPFVEITSYIKNK